MAGSCNSGTDKADETVANSTEESYEFFYQHPTPFSQWTPSSFTVKDVTYNCAEQYMMQQKALLFGDKDSAERIMSTPSPRAQKSLGRKVKKYKEDVWNKKCFNVVKTGNLAKFSQNDEMRSQLFATYPRILVEASPMDRKWGIGLSAGNPLALSKSTWRGRNLLGYVLTEVREELMHDEGLIPNKKGKKRSHRD